VLCQKGGARAGDRTGATVGSPRTHWGRPIEQTSAEKFHVYQERWKLIRSFPSCLGSYVFLWGQKQERTPTWYSMFIETAPARGFAGESTATVDAMAFAWSGSWPENRAPLVRLLEINGKRPVDSLIVKPGTALRAVTSAEDPDGDPLRYVYELLSEPTQLGHGGSPEERPAALRSAVQAGRSTAHMTAPGPGEYRLFVYAFDDRGKVGTANCPFQVSR
jgi:hypothetical protein